MSDPPCVRKVSTRLKPETSMLKLAPSKAEKRLKAKRAKPLVARNAPQETLVNQLHGHICNTRSKQLLWIRARVHIIR